MQPQCNMCISLMGDNGLRRYTIFVIYKETVLKNVHKIIFTCSIMTIHKTGYVGFGLAGYQMWRTEFFQDTIVIILINLPLVVDPTENKGVWWNYALNALLDIIASLIKYSAQQLVSYLTYWSLPPTVKWWVFAGFTKMVYSPTFFSPSFTTTSLLPRQHKDTEREKCCCSSRQRKVGKKQSLILDIQQH